MPQNADYLIWIDLEMSGLNPDIDTIIEIATVVTDSQLETVAEGPVLAIHQPDEILNNMDEWNTKHHGESGLTARVRQSNITMTMAEQATLAFLNNMYHPILHQSVAIVFVKIGVF